MNIPDVEKMTFKDCSRKMMEEMRCSIQFIPIFMYHPDIELKPKEIGAYMGHRWILQIFDVEEARRKNPWIYGKAAPISWSQGYPSVKAGAVIPFRDFWRDHEPPQKLSLWQKIKMALGLDRQSLASKTHL